MRFATALPGPFAVEVPPSPLPDLRVAHLNTALAEQLGLPREWLESERFRRVLAGLEPLPGATAVASAYAGHQFGVFVPQLGDGRAHLIGRWQAPDGSLWEFQLKGSGRTPYSRFGDGRAVLRSSLREYVASEALYALGIPTTRALALGVSDEPVQRETRERAAVVLRVAPSFLRFGHLEYWAFKDRPDAVQTLVDGLIEAHLPECKGDYAAFLDTVIRRTAALMARWQTLGFCHGVMNTDNFSLLGLTLDYGPYGFMDGFDPQHVCNHSDEAGRYAWDQQPAVGLWNCARLLEASLRLLDADPDRAVAKANALLDAYRQHYADTVAERWRAKFGLATARAGDEALMQDFLQRMARHRADFTLAFRELPRRGALRALIPDPGLADWIAAHDARLAAEGATLAERAPAMDAVNPRFVARNHLLQEAISAAEKDDFSVLDRLMRVLARPYAEQPEHAALAALPPAWAATLCISCSS